jgi:hypothetical protein
MAYQLADIVTLVQKRVKDTGYDTSEIKQYINDTQNDVFNEYRLSFMQTSQSYTVPASVTDVTNGTGLPANFLVGIDMLNTTGGGALLIPYKEVSYLDSLTSATSSTSNAPQFWYMYGRTPTLYPVLSSSVTVNFRYYKMPTQLSNDSDVPALPYSFQELLVLGAAYRVMQVKDNYDIAGILQNKCDEILQKLVNMTAVNQVGSSPAQRINRYIKPKRNF